MNIQNEKIAAKMARSVYDDSWNIDKGNNGNNSLAKRILYVAILGLFIIHVVITVAKTGTSLYKSVHAIHGIETAGTYNNIYHDFMSNSETVGKYYSKYDAFNNDMDITNWLYEFDASTALMSYGGSAASMALQTVSGDDSSGSMSMSSLAGGKGYSETNVQTDGVDESDNVITDGRYIYMVKGDYNDDESICPVIDILEKRKDGSGKLRKVSQTWLHVILTGDAAGCSMYIQGDKLIIIGECDRSLLPEYDPEGSICSDSLYIDTVISVVDISDISNPVLVNTLTQSGQMLDSRVCDGYLYTFSRFECNEMGNSSQTEYYIPKVDGHDIKADDIYMQSGTYDTAYTIVTSMKLDQDNTYSYQDEKAVVGYSTNITVSTDNIYVMSPVIPKIYDKTDYTGITKLHYDSGRIEGVSHGEVPGDISDSFAAKEYQGTLRLCMSVDHFKSDFKISKMMYIPAAVNMVANNVSYSDNSVYVLDDDLNIVGHLNGLGADERVYAARFIGDDAYMVTYKETDPLFRIDLSDAINPKLVDALELTGFSEYLHPYGDGKLLGVGYDTVANKVKIAMYDTSDDSHIREITTQNLEAQDADVLMDYKQILVMGEQNLFGFSTSNNGTYTYNLWKYDDENGFIVEMSQSIGAGGTICERGIIMGDNFYVVILKEGGYEITAYDAGNWKQIQVLE